MSENKVTENKEINKEEGCNLDENKTINNKIQIVIDNRKLTLIGPDSQEYMMKVAEFINNKIQEVKQNEATKYLSQTLTLTLAAINVADTYLKEVAQRVKLSEIIKQKDKQIDEYKKVVLSLRSSKGLSIDLTDKLEIDADKLSDEVNELAEKNQRLESENIILKQELEKFKNDLTLCQGEKEKLEQSVADLEKLSTVEQENNQLKKEVEKINEYCEKIISLEDENKSLNEKVEQYHNKEMNVAILEEEVKNLKEKITHLNSDLVRMSGIESENTALKQGLKQLGSDVSKLRSLEAENRNLKEQNKNEFDKYQKYKNEVEKLKSTIEEIKKAKEKLETVLSTVQEEKLDLISKFDILNMELSQKDDEIAQLSDKLLMIDVSTQEDTFVVENTINEIVEKDKVEEEIVEEQITKNEDIKLENSQSKINNTKPEKHTFKKRRKRR